MAHSHPNVLDKSMVLGSWTLGVLQGIKELSSSPPTPFPKQPGVTAAGTFMIDKQTKINKEL